MLIRAENAEIRTVMNTNGSELERNQLEAFRCSRAITCAYTQPGFLSPGTYWSRKAHCNSAHPSPTTTLNPHHTES